MKKAKTMEVEAVVLTTSLYSLRKHYACQPRYDHLVSSLGLEYGDKTPINLLQILDSNGAEDCLWALCATDQNCDMVARLMAADFAEAVLPLYETRYPTDTRPRAAIQAARDFAHGRIGAAAWAAARAAAGAAAPAAAWAAAGDAAWAAAGDTAPAAAGDAAWAAAGDTAPDAAWAAAWAAAGAAAWDAQADIIRRYLKES